MNNLPATIWQQIAALILAALCPAGPARGAEPMPTARQNELVQKYCAVCHTDVARNGGLSLEHFDAAQAPPSLIAMLLSKLTGGVSLDMVLKASSDNAAAALVDLQMKSGAMGAAGIPIPDKAIIDALIQVFAVRSAGAANWTFEHGKDDGVRTASTLREIPRGGGKAEFYRLILSCNPTNRQGAMQLAWSPVAQSGSLTASVDGGAAAAYRVEGSEAMGNGTGVVLHGLAALKLSESGRGSGAGMALPGESLTITDLFPGDTVTFSFASLPREARMGLAACFPESPKGIAEKQ